MFKKSTPFFLFSLAILILAFSLQSCDQLTGKNSNDDKDSNNLIALLALQQAAQSSANNSSNSPPSNLSYTGSPFTFFRNASIGTRSATVTGTVSSCSSNTSLPAGLSINSTNCALTGTPTANQANTSYTISASNSFGSTTTSISIRVQDAVCGNAIIEGNETCDDGNTINADGCNSTCSGT